MRASYRALLLSVVSFSCVHAATVILSQGFDDISTLGSAGWSIQNRSNPAGGTSWFQGSAAIFGSQSGAPNSYAAANFNAASFGGNVSDWLITPTISLDNTEVVTFFTRSSGGAPDKLEVRLSTNGPSTNVGSVDSSIGDFSILLLSVNPTLSAIGYPTTWTQESISLAGLSGLSSGRIAFRYFFSDTSVNGDYVGLDSVSVTTNLPEPSSGTLLGGGIIAVFLVRRVWLGNKKQQLS